ncbi:MAG: hypothetical protein ACI9WU_001839 [Myxococcota bacterium]|jgi:hypothetical protein
MRVPFVLLLASFLAISTGCKDDKKDGNTDGPGGESGRDGPGGPGGPGGDDEGEGNGPPFPPPGATQAEAPPDIKVLMEKMVHAFSKGDSATVASLFINRATFMVVSDCDPVDVVDRVISGGAQAGERAKRDGKGARFLGFEKGQGYLLEVKEGEKPAECRAKKSVTLFLTKYTWIVGGREELGEAHFLRFNGVWFFVKL